MRTLFERDSGLQMFEEEGPSSAPPSLRKAKAASQKAPSPVSKAQNISVSFALQDICVRRNLGVDKVTKIRLASICLQL